MPRGNGGIIGPANIPSTSSAKGVWSLTEQLLAQRQGIWPVYQSIVTFTTSGSWTCPTGVSSIDYLIVAGGGGGGGQSSGTDVGSGGGGAGGFRTGTGLTVTPGTTYTITVGAGGAGGASSGANGTNGSNSSIAGSPITESPSGAGTNTIKSYGGGGGAT